jgi:hypothetical protein
MARLQDAKLQRMALTRRLRDGIERARAKFLGLTRASHDEFMSVRDYAPTARLDTSFYDTWLADERVVQCAADIIHAPTDGRISVQRAVNKLQRRKSALGAFDTTRTARTEAPAVNSERGHTHVRRQMSIIDASAGRVIDVCMLLDF